MPSKTGRRGELVGGAVAVVAAFAGTLILAGMHNYITEDAMFYLRYARNLAEGHGLVYNPGEYYESNTNFLWSVLLVPAFWFNLDPVGWFRFVGLAAGLAAIAMTYIVARQAGTRRDAVFAAVLLGCHSSFAAFAFVGFAPHLPPLFALAAAAFAFRMAMTASAIDAFAAGLCLFLLMLSRLDGAVIAAPFCLFVLWAAWQNKAAFARNFALCAALPAGLFALYLYAKYAYYGDIFPATYYAKADLPPEMKEWFDATGRGIKYTWLYAREYGFVFAAPLLLWGAAKIKGRARGKKRGESQAQKFIYLACAAAVVLWFLYILRIGGGYYEFRFWVAASPFVFILMARAMRELDFRLAAFVACGLVAVSFWHASTYHKTLEESIAASLGGETHSHNFTMTPVQYEDTKKSWTALKEFFAGFDDYSEELKFAIGPGGVGPFFTRFYMMEMRGWADTRIFLPGNHVLSWYGSAGHQHIVSPKHVSERGIHFWLGDAVFYPKNFNAIVQHGARTIALNVLTVPFWREGTQIPPDAKLVELPAGDKKLYAIYWTRSQKIDEFFARNNIVLHDIGPK